MDRKELHNQINDLLNTLRISNERLNDAGVKMTRLDIDHLRKTCIELYDAINNLSLKEMVMPPLKSESQAVYKEIQSDKEPVNDIATYQEDLIEVAPDKEPEKEAIKVPPSESRLTPKFVPIAEKPPVITTPKPKVAEEKMILDKISENRPGTLHDSISSKKEENELLHRFANSRIGKIKEAIDISKRFELQSGLFGGDSNAYNISLSELEIADDRESALEIFDRFSSRYKWSSDNELALELKSFIYRKF